MVLGDSSSATKVPNVEPPSAQSTQPEQIVKSVQPPPIFVYGVQNYIAFAQFLRGKEVADCTRKEINSGLILSIETSDQYHKLHMVLRVKCTEGKGRDTFGALQLHSYQLKSKRAFVVYL